MVLGLVESHTPRALTLSFTHLKSLSGLRCVSFRIFAPIHKASVFLLFNRRPEISLKKSNICKEVVREAGDRSKIRVVSSAYWLIFTSCSFIFMPLMFLFCRIVSASISTQRIKRYGERGQPCLTPLSSLKKLLDQPLLRMQLSVLW